MVSDEAKEILRKAEIAIGVTIILVLALIFLPSQNPITGFVPTDMSLQNLNIILDKSTAYELTSLSEQPVYLQSFRLSGEVIGNGSVAIYLRPEGGKDYLVYTNIGHRETKDNLITGITGMAAASAAEEEEQTGILIEEKRPLANLKPTTEPVKFGLFDNECKETCYLPMDEFNQTSFTMSVYLEPGVVVKLDELSYTLDM